MGCPAVRQSTTRAGPRASGRSQFLWRPRSRRFVLNEHQRSPTSGFRCATCPTEGGTWDPSGPTACPA
eukprot:7815001-Pyramimonas_sp.AAC.1